MEKEKNQKQPETFVMYQRVIFSATAPKSLTKDFGTGPFMVVILDDHEESLFFARVLCNCGATEDDKHKKPCITYMAWDLRKSTGHPQHVTILTEQGRKKMSGAHLTGWKNKHHYDLSEKVKIDGGSKASKIIFGE
jgi:hypothetical protein